MTSYKIQRNSQRISNQNDNPNNESFENVFHGIYNDVLNHATITDDCETFISAKECGESSCYFKGTRDMFFTADRSLTTNSIPSSVASSDMLSTTKTNDDDLSYITEPGSLLSNIGEVVQASEIDRSLKFIVEHGNDEPSNLRRVSEAPYIFGIGVQKEFGRSISDLDFPLTPILEFDDDLKDAPLRLVSHASIDSYYCDCSSNQLCADNEK